MPDIVIQKVATRLNLILALLCGLPVLTAVVLTVIWCWQAVEVHRELENIRAQGLPTSPAEINDYYRIAPGTVDSTALWVAAFKSLEAAAPRDNLTDYPFFQKPHLLREETAVSEDLRSQARQLLSDLQPELNAIRVAAAAGGVTRFPVDFSAGDDTQMPHLQQVRTTLKLLQIDQMLAQKSGNFEHALHAVVQMFATSHCLSAEPAMLTHLLRIVTYKSAADAVEEILQQHAWTDDELSLLQVAASKPDFRRELSFSLPAERAMLTSAIETLNIGPMTVFNLKTILRLFPPLIVGVEQEWPAPLKPAAELDSEFENHFDGLSRATWYAALEYMPAVTQCVEITAQAEARRRTLMALIAAQRYRLKHDRWPESLGEIEPPLFGTNWRPAVDGLDPFTGLPLFYKLTDTDLRIYSVGLNRTDEGGMLVSPEPPPPDVGYFLRR